MQISIPMLRSLALRALVPPLGRPLARRRSPSHVRASSSSSRPAVDVGSPPHVALVTFQRTPGAHPELGIVENAHWLWTLDFDGTSYPNGMLSLIEKWHDQTSGGRSSEDILEHERKGDPVPVDSVTLLAPIPNPPSIVCIGKNYLEHIGEVDSSLPGISTTGAAPPEYPIIFTKALTSVTGHKQPIIIPKNNISKSVDYEGELGVVIGKNVKPGEINDTQSAWDAVFGFTIVNDVTARDVQKQHQQWYLGKSFDTFCPLGPWIVPKKNLLGLGEDTDANAVQSLIGKNGIKIGTCVNGEWRQSSDTSNMLFDVPDLLQIVNRAMSLRVGDIVATGTPSGVGAGMDPKGFLKAGDTCEVVIQGIGTLRNPVE